VTPLEGVIRAIIESEGPMRLDRYMALCLGHPQFGYYMTRDPFGEAGDFVTAPEISQMFGELIGVWCASQWRAMGSPSPFNLVEFGPGRGTLMADLLRAGRVMPDFVAAARVHLIETSPVLRAVQKARLRGNATWHDSLASVPQGPAIFVANEFFDAIPIRQFEWREGHGFERCVGLGEGVLRLGLTPAPRMTDPKRSAASEESVVIEDSSQRDAIAAEIGARLADAPGAALIIDYGHLHSAAGDTLQAVRRHAFVDILDHPGEADVTAHVDFEALARAIASGGATAYAALTQRGFLLAMGLEERARILGEKMGEDALAARERLAGEAQMGNLFKVLTATSAGFATPYPFAPP
jgi:NADH dehydrogenase [ubiquinone] 1 alpha subcomplex assembly factor 7